MRFFPAFYAGLFVAALHGAEPPPEAQRYYEMLQKRPQPGVIFDRFADAWVATGSVDDLLKFLSDTSARKEATAADHLLLAYFHSRQGDESASLAAFVKALELNPKDASAWLERARLEMRLLDFNAALKSLDTALAQQPEVKLAVTISKLRGRVLLRTGKPDDALNAWRELLKTRPDDEDLAEEVVDLQLDEGLNAEASAGMLALIEKTADPYAKVARRLRLANIYLRGENKADALKQLSECLVQSGRDTWIEGESLAQVEQLFRREDNLTGLAEYLGKLNAEGEPRVAVQRQLARVLAESGSKEKALEVYVSLLERTPGRRDLRESYLDLLERLEKYPEAIAQTKLLIEQHPSDKELQLRLALVLQVSRDPKGADEALAAYLKAAGTGEFDHLRVGRLLEQWGRNEDAKAAYTRMVQTYPESTSARDAQAQFLHRIGDKDAAIAIWKELASKGGLDEVLAVAQTLIARLEGKAAYELLSGRLKDFPKEPRLLAPLITAAISVKAQKEAIPWALERVRLTQDEALLDDAIRQALTVLDGSDQKESTIAGLKSPATPTFSERALLAALLEDTGNPEAAENTLRTAIPAEATAAQARLVRLIESRRDWTRTAAELEKLITMPGGRTSQNVQRLIEVKQRAGELEAALKLIADWKTLSPGTVQPWLSEAGLLNTLNRPKESIQVLQAAARKFDDDAGIASALAMAHAEAGEFATAERILLKLMEKEEQVEDKLRWVGTLATTAQTRGMLKPVTDRFLERQRTNRGDTTPWLALAEIYRVSENKTEQRRCLAEAARLLPRDISLLHNIARVDEDLGDWKRALRTLEQAVPLDNSTRTRHLIAGVQLRWGDESEAFRILTELSGGSQMDPKDVLKLADAIMGRDQWKQGVKFLEPFIERHPKDYRLRYVRAVALGEMGDNPTAIEDFLKLTTGTEELPEVLKAHQAAARSANPTADWMAQFEKLYPPGMRQLMEVAQSNYQARQHTYRRQQGGQSATGAGISVPTDVKTAQQYALVNLVLLAQQEKPEARQRILTMLKGAGWDHAETLLSMQIDPNSPWSLSITEEALKANPKDPLLNAGLLTFSGYGRGNTLGFEPAANAFEALKDKYPFLAVTAASLAVRADTEKGTLLLEDGLQRLEAASQKPATTEYNYYASYIISTLLGGGQRVDKEQRIELPEPLRKKIRAMLVAGADPQRIAKVASSSNPWLASSLVHAVNALRADAAWDEYIRLWDAHFATFHAADPALRKRLAGMPWSAAINMNQQQDELFKALEFPPLSTSMPGLFSIMMCYDDPYNPHVKEWRHPGPEEDFAPVAKLLDTIKDPALRLVLAYKAGQPAVTEQELNKRISASTPSTDDLYLAASFFSAKGDHRRAVDLLLRCISGPMEPADRNRADAALVYATITMKEEERKALSADTMKAAQQAVRRFRNGQLAANQRDEIGSALATLGLKDEADQWKRLAAAAPATSSTVASSSRQQRTDRIDALIRQKAEPEAILRVAVQELKVVHGNYWRQGNESYARREATNLVAKLSFPDARAKLITMLEAPVDASETRRLESAEMLDLLNESAKALDIYEDVVKKNPRQAEARHRQIILAANKDPKKAGALLQEITWEMMAQGIGSGLVRTLYSGERCSFEAKMNLFEALALYLEKLSAQEPDLPRGAVEWASHLTDAAGRYDSTASLPYLYFRRQEGYSPTKENLERRLKVHDALCRAVMKHPEIASTGFSGLVALAIREKQDLEPFAPMAEKILRDLTAQRARGKTHRGTPAVWNWGSTRSYEIWQPTPVEFLVWQAWKKNEVALIEKDILPLIQGALSGQEERAARDWVNLWTCAPEQFATVAKASGNSMNALQYNQGGGALLGVMECWRERALPVESIEDYIVNELKRNSGGDVSEIAGYYLSLRIARKEPYSTLEEGFRRLVTRLIGPESGWNNKLNTIVNYRYGRGQGTWDASSYAILNMMEVLIRNPETSGTGLKFSAMLGLLKHDVWRLNNVDTAMPNVVKDAASVMDLLSATPFLAEAANFEVWGGSSSRYSSPLTRIVSEIKLKPEVKSGVKDALQQYQPRTFGVEFVQCLLDDNQAGALTSMLKRRAPDLKLIPEKQHAELAALITSYIPALKQPTTMDPGLRSALEPLMAAQFKAQEQRYDAWMKAVKLTDLKAEDRACEDDVIRITGELAMQSPDKAKAFFLKALKLIEAKEASSQFDARNSGNGWMVRSDLLAEISKAYPKMEVMALAMKLYQEDDTSKLTMNGWSNDGKWGTVLFDIWKAAGGQSDLNDGLEAMLKRTHEALGSTPHTLMPLAFYDFFSKLPQSQRMATIRWAEQPGSDTQLAILRRELALGGRFFIGTDSGMRGNADLQKQLQEMGGLQAVWDDALALLKNDALNPRARLALGHYLCHRAPLFLPDNIANAAAALALQTLKDGGCIHGYQYGWIMQAYNRVPVDDTWKTNAQAHWEAWVMRTTTTPRSSSLRYNPCDWCLHQMIRLAGRADQREWISRLISKYNTTLSNEPSALAMLVASGQSEEAAEWLKRNWSRSIYDPEKNLVWDEAFSTGLPKFRETCGSPDLALLGEIMLAIFPDPPKQDQAGIAGFEDRNKRLVALAEKLPTVTFADPAMRTRCLEYLAQIYDTYEPLAKEFDEAAANTDIGKIAAMDNTWQHWHKYKPLRASITRKMVHGDSAPAIQAYDTVLKSASGERYLRQSAVKEVGWDPLWGVPYRLSRMENPDWRPLLGFVNHLLAKTPDDAIGDHIGDAVSLKLMIHYALGEPDAITAWRKDLTVDRSQKLEDRFSSRFELWAAVREYGGQPKARVPVEKRAALVAALMKDPWVMRRYPETGTNLPNLISTLVSKARVFTPEELPSAWKPIAEAFPRKGKTATEAADLLAQNGKLAEAVEAFDFAAAQMMPKEYGTAAGFLYRKAEVLVRMGRKDEAITVLESFDEKKIGPGLKAQRTTMLQRLKS